MKKFVLFILLTSSLITSAQKKVNPANFAKTITADDLRKHLFIVAGKEMEGRETATEGQRKAAAYIEGQFRSLGLLPGNNGNYQLNYPVYQDSLLNTSVEINGQGFNLDKDFSVTVGQNNTATYRFAEVVFAGNGIVDSMHDDYKGQDVRGKVVLILSGQPAQSGGNRFANPKLEAAQKNGAVAVLIVGSSFPRQMKTSPKGNMYLSAFQRSVRPNQFTISEKMAEAIMGTDYANAKSGNIKSKIYTANVMLNFNKIITNLQSSNMLGLLEGTDLKDEYVFITAHYDHLG
ncbi:MAG TPA: PA domain-containing protein, partial [Chitinophagaceae bacterium]|nr:PA domain-containing protein [Chitinophagaceae bacterium]